MAAEINSLSHIANPLISIEQLSQSSSSLDGVPKDLEDSVRYAGARLTQAAGQLLGLPQYVIAQAVVLFTRFWTGAEGGSMLEFGARDISAACLYLVTKVSAYPKSPRTLLSAYAVLDRFTGSLDSAKVLFTSHTPDTTPLSEGTLQTQRQTLFTHESLILRTLGFQTHVATPHALVINYLQALDVFRPPSAGQRVAKRAWAIVNTALLSPQLLCVTHQPTQLATAAIYLAARQEHVKLPECEWWEVFDTEREDLGFLCVAFLSMEKWASNEAEVWRGREVPMNPDEVARELNERQERMQQETNE